MREIRLYIPLSREFRRGNVELGKEGKRRAELGNPGAYIKPFPGSEHKGGGRRGDKEHQK